MRKSISLVVAAALLLSATFSGCGSKTENTAAPQQSTAAEKKAKPVKLSITWWGSQSRHDYTQKLLTLYTEKNPNVTFESTPAGWDGYYNKVAALAAGNSLPDIIQMARPYLTTYTKNDTLEDLASYVNDKSLDLSDVDKNLADSGRINGKLVAVVLGSSSLAVSCNPDVFKKAGLELPKSDWKWADFEKIMLTIKEKTGGYGVSRLEYGAYATFPYWIRQRGKTLFAQDGSKLGYDDDKIFVDFVNMLMRLQKSKAFPTPDEASQIATKGKEAEPVVQGTAGALFDWSNYGVIVAKSNPNIKLVPLPMGDNGEKALWISPSQFFSINKSSSSENKKEAAKFLNWFINDVEANKVILGERGVPPSEKIRTAIKPMMDAQSQAMFDYIDVATKLSTPIDPPEPAGIAEVDQAFINSINLAMYNKATPEQAAADFRKKANEILARASGK